MKNIIYIIITIFIIQIGYAQQKHPFIKSAILPGWGELTYDKTDRAKSFFVRESLIWLSLLGSQYVSSNYESKYSAFSRLHADIDLSDKEYQFVVDIGNYDSLEDYNDAKERTRQFSMKYPEGEGYEWEWDTSENRLQFDEYRITSSTADKFSSFTIAGLILHRVISLIDVLYLERIGSKIDLESAIIPLGKDQVEFRLGINF
jgi:hypothetical protein